MWQDLLAQLGGFAVLVAALAWLSRRLIGQLLDRDIEAHKAHLESQNQIQLERLRAEFRQKAIEHEVRFRSIHEKQAEVIADTYAKLVEVQRCVASYVAIFELSGEPSKKDKLEAVGKAYEDFRRFFYPRQIYLPTATRDKVRALADKLAQTSNDFTHGLAEKEERRAASGRVGDSRKVEDDPWFKAHESMKSDVPSLLREMESEFQQLLGVRGCSESG